MSNLDPKVVAANRANDLKRRVFRPGGKSLQELKNSGRRALDETSRDARPHFMRELEGARKLFANLRSGDQGLSKDVLDELFRVAHDAKGLGGAVGYPLLTQIAAITCEMLRDLMAGNPRTTELLLLVSSELDAMMRIVVDDIKGNGGDSEQALVAQLRRAASMVSSRI